MKTENPTRWNPGVAIRSIVAASEDVPLSLKMDYSSPYVYEIDPVCDPRWTTFVENHPQASIFHSKSWLKALQTVYGYEPVVVTTCPSGASRGPYKGVLRYHLGLIIPGPEGSCRIRVGNDVRGWKEGKSMIFDDSNEHEVWNDNDSYRVVLFVDFVRPTIFPISIVNRTIIWARGRYPL